MEIKITAVIDQLDPGQFRVSTLMSPIYSLGATPEEAKHNFFASYLLDTAKHLYENMAEINDKFSLEIEFAVGLTLEESQARRKAALDELTKIDQELGFYDAPPDKDCGCDPTN